MNKRSGSTRGVEVISEDLRPDFLRRTASNGRLRPTAPGLG